MSSSTVVPKVVQGNIPPYTLWSFRDDVGEPFPVLLRRYRLGLALFMAAILMLFVGFSSAYVVRRGIPTYDVTAAVYSQAWEPMRLPLRILVFNTGLLMCASLTIEMARRTTKFSKPSLGGMTSTLAWLRWSLLFSVLFVVGQVLVWQSLWTGGHTMSAGARTAFFYVLTGTHVLHLSLGITALIWIRVRIRRWSAINGSMSVDLAAWYLHSITLLWVYIFCFLFFA